jgi:cyanophycinase
MPRGKLVVIGGAEDKDGKCSILAEIVRLAGGGSPRVTVVTAATNYAEMLGERYVRAFGRLGAGRVDIVDVSSRIDAERPEALDAIEDSNIIFFTGGDQLAITACLGGTPMERLLHHRFEEDGVLLAGTSAGAAVMAPTMILGGQNETSPQFGLVQMSPGMGFLPGTIVEQHFAQRGRYGRLLSAVGQNPGYLGLGIDEDTAAVVDGDMFYTFGEGAVTVFDAADVSFTNVGERPQHQCLALFGVKLHVVPHGYWFHLTNRCPLLDRRGVAPVEEQPRSVETASDSIQAA